MTAGLRDGSATVPVPRSDGATAGGAAMPRWVHDLVLLVAIVVVAFPILAMSVHQVRVGWVPVNDNAIIFTRTYDVLSDTPPLVGQYTMASDGNAAEQAAYSPGPLPYQLLAVPAHLLSPEAMPVVVGLISAGSLAAVLVLVRRRGGTGLVVAVALGLTLVERALGPVTMVEVWNPHLAMAPFVLLLVVCWSVAAGDRWLLPVGIGLFSLVGQAHLTYVAPGLAALVVALAGGWGPEVVGALRRRRAATTRAAATSLDDLDADEIFVDEVRPARSARPVHGEGDGDSEAAVPGEVGVPAAGAGTRWRAAAGSPWAPIVASVIVGLLCWATPLYQQVTGDPGNLTLVLESNAGDREHFGSQIANVAFVDTYGVMPSFTAASLERRLFLPGTLDLRVGPTIGAFLVLGSVAVVGVVGWRRRDRAVVTLAALVLAVAPTVWWIVSAFPVDRALASGYSFRWFVVAGMLAWLAGGWGLVRLWGAPAAAELPARAPAFGVGLVLVAAAVVGAQAARTPHESRERLESTYDAAGDLGDALDAATTEGGRYRVAPSGVFRYTLDPALTARLRWTGRNPVLGDERVVNWGQRYAADGVPCDGVIRVLGPGDQLPGGTVVGTTSMLVNGELVEARLALAPDTPEGTC
jgi:hypothetical protein